MGSSIVVWYMVVLVAIIIQLYWYLNEATYFPWEDKQYGINILIVTRLQLIRNYYLATYLFNYYLV